MSIGVIPISAYFKMQDLALAKDPLPRHHKLVRKNLELFDVNSYSGQATLNPFELSKQLIFHYKETNAQVKAVQQQLQRRVEVLKHHNMAVFVGSGNDAEEIRSLEHGLGGKPFPEEMHRNALHVPGVISVGASEWDGTLTSYSNHYEGVRYTAPMPWRKYGYGGSPVAGTSFSTPQVAAAGAYLLKEKQYTVDEMLHYLDAIGKPMETKVNGVAYPYTFLPFDKPMLDELKNAPRKMRCDAKEAPRIKPTKDK
jgi:hypothetical protein